MSLFEAYSWPYDSEAESKAREFYDGLHRAQTGGIHHAMACGEVALVESPSGNCFVGVLVLTRQSGDDSMEIFDANKDWLKRCGVGGFQDYESVPIRGDCIRSSLDGGYTIISRFRLSSTQSSVGRSTAGGRSEGSRKAKAGQPEPQAPASPAIPGVPWGGVCGLAVCVTVILVGCLYAFHALSDAAFWSESSFSRVLAKAGLWVSYGLAYAVAPLVGLYYLAGLIAWLVGRKAAAGTKPSPIQSNPTSKGKHLCDACGRRVDRVSEQEFVGFKAVSDTVHRYTETPGVRERKTTTAYSDFQTYKVRVCDECVSERRASRLSERTMWYRVQIALAVVLVVSAVGTLFVAAEHGGDWWGLLALLALLATAAVVRFAAYESDIEAIENLHVCDLIKDIAAGKRPGDRFIARRYFEAWAKDKTASSDDIIDHLERRRKDEEDGWRPY